MCFIDVNHTDSFLKHLSHQDLSNRWLPEKPDVVYTFAGEIPWCDTFPENGLSEFSFVIKEENVTVQRTQQEFYLDGESLGWTEFDFIRRSLLDNTPAETEEEHYINNEDLERIEVREVPVEVEEVERTYENFDVLIPVCDFAWEGYQTAANDAGHATTLAKEIASDLKLVGQPQTFDLFTTDGARATFNVSDQSNDFNNQQWMFFIEENLLKTYLERNNLVLVWAICGERRYSAAQIDRLSRSPDRPEQSRAVFSFVRRYE
jgi:hypothetical protein